MVEKGQLGRTWDDLKAGRISRREFIEKATALGVGLPVVLSGGCAMPHVERPMTHY